MKARIQREALSLRISVTDRCQMRCLYCMPSGSVGELHQNEVLSLDEILRFVGAIESNFGLSKVHITGGEPLMRPDIIELIEMLNCEGIADLALTTNAQLLGEMAWGLKRTGLRRINISLDSLNPETFRKLTGGELGRTLAGLEAALSCGLSPVKLNTLVLRDINEDESIDIVQFGLSRGCQVRFLELMPIGAASSHFDDWFVSSDEVRAKLSESFDLRPQCARAGTSSRNYTARDREGRKGTIGFISSHTQPFCQGCRRLRLSATGRLLGCLARREGIEVRHLLRSGEEPELLLPLLVEAAERALSLKRAERWFASQRPMAKIGG